MIAAASPAHAAPSELPAASAPSSPPGTSLALGVPRLAVRPGELPTDPGEPRAAAPRPAIAGAHIDHDGFDADIAADGTVHLHDRNVRVAIAAKQLVEDYVHGDMTLGGSAGDPARAHPYQDAPGSSVNLGAASSVNATANSATHTDSHGHTFIAPVLSGTFDVTDALMRGHAADPYTARKRAFLDSTRDARAELGTRTRVVQLAHAAELMQRNLSALWADRTLDLAAKKRALFDLWDECAEDGDADLVHGGGDARQLVLDFIRTHLPAGSASAFTPAELADLSRHRQSGAAFRPYGE